MIKLKKSSALFILLFLAFMASAQSKKIINGIYVSTGYDHYRLIFGKSDFSLLQPYDWLDGKILCDTLAFGSFNINRDGYLEMDTPSQIDDHALNMTVKEGKSNDIDTVVFHIHNPIEELHAKNKIMSPDLTYTIHAERIATAKNGWDIEGESPEFVGGEFKWEIPRGMGIKHFYLIIQPNFKVFSENLGTKMILTIDYRVKDSTSNVFDVYIPEVSYEYLSCQRFHGEYAKIINNDIIIWRGNRYVRKGSN
jgi:hypothetical protein